MKRGKRLTRDQKKLLAGLGYEPKKYLLLYELEMSMVVKDKETGLPVVIKKVGK